MSQENPQAEGFGGKTFVLAEQEPLFLVTLSGQLREGARRPLRMRGHKRQCWELWKHIWGGHLNISIVVTGCSDGLAVRLGPGQRRTIVPMSSDKECFSPEALRPPGCSSAGQQEAWSSPDWQGDKASSLFSAFSDGGQSDVAPVAFNPQSQL